MISTIELYEKLKPKLGQEETRFLIEKIEDLEGEIFEKVKKEVVTKESLREELKPFATKEDLEKAPKPFATKEDLEKALKPFATREELKDLEIRINERIHRLEIRLVIGFLVLGFLIILSQGDRIFSNIAALLKLLGI